MFDDLRLYPSGWFYAKAGYGFVNLGMGFLYHTQLLKSIYLRIESHRGLNCDLDPTRAIALLLWTYLLPVPPPFAFAQPPASTYKFAASVYSTASSPDYTSNRKWKCQPLWPVVSLFSQN
jgi:hypothetical protein